MTDPKYPIGKFEAKPFDQAMKSEWIRDIQLLPQNLEAAVLNLDASQLDTPYREGGWTVKQLIHHVADSHMNAYIRFKLGLTEEKPTIKPYEEQLWAELSDSKNIPINVSLTLLHALHLRWADILLHIKDEEWDRKVFHPGSKKEMSLWFLLGLYAWHSKHHTEHILVLRKGKGW